VGVSLSSNEKGEQKQQELAEEDNNGVLFIRAISNWNKGDLNSYLLMYDPSVVIHGIPGVEAGIESAKKFYQGIHRAFPDTQILVEDLFTRADKLACRFTVSGTHKAEFMGIPATDKFIKFTGITILKFLAGKCTERWNEADFLGMLQQLGTIPEKTS
jgi:predicted ester cyclase